MGVAAMPACDPSAPPAGQALVPTASFSLASGSAVEGGDITFFVRLSERSASRVVVFYVTNDVTAVAQSDLQQSYNIFSPGEVIFEPGNIENTLTISTATDSLDEPDETFEVVLIGGSNVAVDQDNSRATGTITDNSPEPAIDIDPQDPPPDIAVESDGGVFLNFRVLDSQGQPIGSGKDITVPLDITQSPTGRFTFPASVTIPAENSEYAYHLEFQDGVTKNPSATLTLALGTPTNASLGDFALNTAHTINVYDDEATGVPNDTGVQACYGDTALAASCPAQFDTVGAISGQDAENGVGAFDFATPVVMNVDEHCVLDNRTGLMWEIKTANPQDTVAVLRAPDEEFIWHNPHENINGGDAGSQSTGSNQLCHGPEGFSCDTASLVDKVNELGLCGHYDWRLPKLHELLTIVDYEVASGDPTIDTSVFSATPKPENPTNPTPIYYWTATPSASNPKEAWAVDFSMGMFKPGPKSTYGRVRLVRTNNQ